MILTRPSRENAHAAIGRVSPIDARDYRAAPRFALAPKWKLRRTSVRREPALAVRIGHPRDRASRVDPWTLMQMLARRRSGPTTPPPTTSTIRRIRSGTD